MSLIFIILLILLGALFLIAEVVLLPGISVGAILALACDAGACYWAFVHYGVTGGIICLLVVAVVSAAATVFSLRAKTWQRLSLNQELESKSMPAPEESLEVGMRGRSISRLAPMGKVEINGHTYEAKSTGAYINAQCEVEVVGFENFSVIVKAA